MSTETVHRAPTKALGPWFVWSAITVVAVIFLGAVAMWLVPRLAPVWVATHSPFFAHVVYALEQEGAGKNQAYDAIRERIWQWDWDAARILRRRLEAAQTSDATMLEANLLTLMCSKESLTNAAAAHMSQSEASAWAERYLDQQRDDLLACGMWMLSNTNWFMRYYGANCLGDLGDRRARVALEAHLGESDQVRRMVLGALEQLGDPASIPAIVQAVLHSPESHPMDYLSVIGALAVVVPEEHLLTVLKHPSPFVRLWALKHLGTQRTSASLPILVSLAADEDERVAKQARDQLLTGISTGDFSSLLGFLHAPDARLRAGSGWALSRLGDRRAVAPLIDLLVRSEGFIEPEVEAALLGCLPAESDAELQAGFAHPSGTVRAWIARRIAIRHLLDAPAFLLAHVDDPEPQVRAAIYRALGELRVRDALPRLQQAMGSGVVFERAAAIRALGDMKDPAYRDPLCALLRAKERRLRQAAAQALGALGDPAAMAELRLAQDDPEPAVREAVRQALEQLSGDDHELRAVEGRRLQEFVEPAALPSPPTVIP